MLITLLRAGALAAFLVTPALAESIAIMDAYARSASPTARSGAAFMMINNTGTTDDRLVSASAAVSERVELHTHIEDANGVMRMIEVEDGFAIPANGSTVLQRGGMHVMFLGLNAPLAQGERFPLTLVFEQAGEIVVDVVVDSERQPAHGGHGMSN